MKMEATAQETAVATRKSATFARNAPFGVMARTARMEPGDAGAIRPPPRRFSVKTPDMPPAMTARTRTGFMRIYGK